MSVFEEARQAVSKALALGLYKEDAIKKVAATFAQDGTDQEVAILFATEFINNITKDIIWREKPSKQK